MDDTVLRTLRESGIGFCEGCCRYGIPAAPLGIQLHSWGWLVGESPTYDEYGGTRGADQAMLQITLSGEGRLSRQGREQRLGPGTALLATLPGEFRYWTPPGQRWEFLFLTLMGGEAIRLVHQLIGSAGCVLDLRASQTPRLAAELIVSMVRIPPPSAFVASAGLWRVMTALAEELLAEPDDTALTGPIADAVAFGHLHWSENPTVDDLAAAAGMSRHHFSRCFSAATGLPPGKWIDRVRMTRAAEMLHQLPRASIAQVAEACGFREANYFACCFRRVVGMSPSEWRTRLRS